MRKAKVFMHNSFAGYLIEEEKNKSPWIKRLKKALSD